MGDQLCYLKVAYLFAENERPDRILMSMSPGNEMSFVWSKFIEQHNVEVILDSFDPGDWSARWSAWDKWRGERVVEGRPFDLYREMYLRIHGAQRQTVLCGRERGLGRRNIYEYVYFGQENQPDSCPGSDWFDSTLMHHPPHRPTRGVYVSPHAKTQGNLTFTFEFWAEVVKRLLDAGVAVTVGYDGPFCEDLNDHPLYRKHWGSHWQWVEEVCSHKVVACGNTGTGWLAAACGVPLFTVEPPNSQMPDHRYRECGLRNLVEVLDHPDASYCARRLTEEVNRCVVLTTGCYDVLHAGHVRHLERSRALGTKLVVAVNSDASVRRLKGETRPINSENRRRAVLEALRCVDEVRVTDDPMEVVRELKPDVLTNGYGYTLDRVVGREFVESYGGRAVVTCHSDASDLPSTTSVVRRVKASDVVEACRLATAVSVNPAVKLRFLAEQLLAVAHVPGDVVDLGSYRGGAALVMKKLAPSKTLHLFDTWEGNPHDDPLCHHRKGEWVASLEECERVVGVDLSTRYHPGVFPGTAAGLEDSEFCFVFADMDTYQSTKDAVEFFWPRLSQGGRMLFDDYGWEPCAGVKAAVDELLPNVKVAGYMAVAEKL